MELETDLRVTSDRMLRTLEQLAALENEKRITNPGSPRFKRLAVEVERLAAALFAQTHAQQQLADRSHAVVVATGDDLTPIEDIQPGRDLQVVLAEWRDAERRLAATEPDTAAHAQAQADIARLRDEYKRTYEAQRPDSPAGRG